MVRDIILTIPVSAKGWELYDLTLELEENKEEMRFFSTIRNRRSGKVSNIPDETVEKCFKIRCVPLGVKKTAKAVRRVYKFGIIPIGGNIWFVIKETGSKREYQFYHSYNGSFKQSDRVKSVKVVGKYKPKTAHFYVESSKTHKYEVTDDQKTCMMETNSGGLESTNNAHKKQL